MKYKIYDADGIEISLPLKWEICGGCNGNGAANHTAYTWEEMEEKGEDFIEDYLAGRYDRCCEACGGSGKVKAVDRERTSPELLELLDESIREERAHRREVAMELAMGA